MKDRFAAAADLREIGRLLAIKGENIFRTQAYARAAASLENLDRDLRDVVEAGELRRISGVGETLAGIIEELYRTGECWMLGQLREAMPPGVLELSAVPGLSLKKIAALHDALGVSGIADLKAACESGRVATVRGFGLKSQAGLLTALEKMAVAADGRLLLHQAEGEADRLLTHLCACPESREAERAGALRRRKETVRRIVLVASGEAPAPILDRFLSFPAMAHSEVRGPGHAVGRLAGGFETELTIVPPERYAAALQEHTGSRGHMTRLGERARRRGQSFDAIAAACRSEAEIYRALGLDFIPPELRENQGEIEAAAAGTLPDLLEISDLRGMTHCHSDYSDGRNSIEEMARAAEAMGMSYLTITDHSPTAHYAGGVGIDRLRAQWDEIDRVQEKVKLRILKGTESDICEDGSLDYPDYILDRFDIIIASIHVRHKMDAERMTQRLLRALRSPRFKIWGHPLGRLLLSRPAFDCRMEAVLDAAAESKCAIEINGEPHRLDLEPRWIRAARKRGLKFIVSTDAHSVNGFANLRFGVAMARRGWLSPADVLNTRDAGAFTAAVRP